MLDQAPEPQPKVIEGLTGPWEMVIGLEVHAQVATQAKLFSGASTAVGAEPNSQVSFVDAGMPGMLPVLNPATAETIASVPVATPEDVDRAVAAARGAFPAWAATTPGERSLALLRPVKGAVVGLQWALYMHGFGGEPDRIETHPEV